MLVIIHFQYSFKSRFCILIHRCYITVLGFELIKYKVSGLQIYLKSYNPKYVLFKLEPLQQAVQLLVCYSSYFTTRFCVQNVECCECIMYSHIRLLYFLNICCWENAHNTVELTKPPTICLFVVNVDHVT